MKEFNFALLFPPYRPIHPIEKQFPMIRYIYSELFERAEFN